MPRPHTLLQELEQLATYMAGLNGKMIDAFRDGRGGPPVGFTLLVFTMEEEDEDDRWMTYVSSAERLSMMEALREMLGKLENDPNTPNQED